MATNMRIARIGERRGTKVWIIVSALASFALVCWGLYWVLFIDEAPRRFTPEMCDKIKLGMSYFEARRILGVSSGDYATDPEATVVRFRTPLGEEESYTSRGFVWKDGSTTRRWKGDYGEITLRLNSEGKVLSKQWTAVSLPNADSPLKWKIRQIELRVRKLW
jgi:hypothetical protein